MVETATNLTGKILIAMPGMGDPRFSKGVILVCAHGEDGAMGIMINKPAPELGLNALLEQLEIPSRIETPGPIHFGGPVEGARGFVLHSQDYDDDPSTLSVNDSISMTATLDILRAMARGDGPDRTLVALGYSGWAAGQIEIELAENVWLVADATPEVVFDDDDSRKWLSSIATLGIDPIMLSGAAGRA